ncbi:hypothetical protein BH23CHL8_BH23CHL8_03390 [soil metagenome]
MGGIGRLVRIVILVAVALALVLTVALPPPSAAAASASPAPDIPETEPAEPTSLGGRWRKLPRSPFGAVSPAAVWTGSRMVVADPRSRRTATYDPVARRWEEHERAPWTFHLIGPVVWTEREMIVLDREEQVAAGYAFDPDRGRWRTIATPPSPELRAAVWSGDVVVAATVDRRAAAYDPVEDAWLVLPQVPVPTGPAWRRAYEPSWELEGLHWTGDRLIAVMEPDDGGLISIATLDPVTWAWVLEPQGEMIWAYRSSSIWAAGRLWFLSFQANRFGVTNATYDLATDTWEPYEGECLIAGRAIWTGRLILEGGVRRALDPATGECYRAPRPRDRNRVWYAEVWTGRELILWSGSRGEHTRPLPDGISYRPRLDALGRPRVAQQEGTDVRD